MSTLAFPLILLLGYYVLVALGLAVALRLFDKKLTGDLLVSGGTPICLWLFLAAASHGKSLSNAVTEPLILAVAVLAIAVVRLSFDGRGIIGDSTLKTLSIVVSLLLALCVVFFMPWLPE